MSKSLGGAVSPAEGPTEAPAGQPGDRDRAAPESAGLVVVAPVEQLRRRVQRLRYGFVVGVPPEVAQARARPGDELDVKAFVEAELGVRAPQPGVLHATPGTGAGAVRVHV